MIDDLTIAAHGRIEGPPSVSRTGQRAVTSGFLNMFGNILDRSVAQAASKIIAIPANGGSEGRTRDLDYRTPDFREAPTGREYDTDRALDDDENRVDAPDTQQIDSDDDETDPINPVGSGNASGRSDRPGSELSDMGSALMFAGKVAAVADESNHSDNRADARLTNRAPTTLDPRTTIVEDTPDLALHPGAVLPLAADRVQSGRGAPYRMATPTIGDNAQTTTSFGATTGVERQSAGLARVIGEPGTTRIAVTVAAEASGPASQTSFILPSARAGSKEIRPSDAGRDVSGRSAPSVPISITHPNTPPAQIQIANALMAGSAQTVQVGKEAVPIAANAAVANAGGPPAAAAQSIEDAAIGPSSFENLRRAATLTGTRANSSEHSARLDTTLARQISLTITKAIKADSDRIEIRLRPESLGRVEISLEVARDGRVAAAVTTDNRETLELLKASVRDLEKALLEAGLKADTGSLSFSLRGQDTAAQEEGYAAPDLPTANIANRNPDDDELPTVETGSYPPGFVTPDGRVDIRA